MTLPTGNPVRVTSNVRMSDGQQKVFMIKHVEIRKRHDQDIYIYVLFLYLYFYSNVAVKWKFWKRSPFHL